MTALVSLLLMLWSLLIVKSQIFPYTCLFAFFSTSIILFWWTHKCYFKRKNDHEYYFYRCHTHYLIKSLHASKLCKWDPWKNSQSIKTGVVLKSLCEKKLWNQVTAKKWPLGCTVRPGFKRLHHVHSLGWLGNSKTSANVALDLQSWTL